MARGPDPDPEPRCTPATPELVAEFGALDLWHMTVRVDRRVEAEGRARLARLADHFRPGDLMRERGGRAVHVAYPAFERQVGLDPATATTAVERDALSALYTGTLRPKGVVDDALLAVLAAGGVPVWALDAARVRPPFALRPARPGERLGRREPLAPGALVLADADRPLAPLLGDPVADVDGRRARTVVLMAYAVPDLPSMEASEAVWTAKGFLSRE